MSASSSTLAPLLSTHDLKLICAGCCIKANEITYKLKSVVHHRCARNLLLCKAKGSSRWRPISKRPTFPNPSRYDVCCFFVEGRGCRQHKNRCTFARSFEEVAVWTFAKRHRLDHLHLCSLVGQLERGSPDRANRSEPLGDVLAIVDLKAACHVCSVQEKEITYRVQTVRHKCSRNLLLVKAKASSQWRPVSERPTDGNFGRNVFYQRCHFFVEGSGCTHKQGCTYARSDEEAAVWNYIKDKRIDKDDLIRLVTESEPVSVTPESTAESIFQQFPGEFIEFCKKCFQALRLTTKRWNATCAADAAHTWDPVLVHHLSENSAKHVYSQVRPLPPNCPFKYCRYVTQGKPCWHQAGSCQLAQSEVEMAVWKAEHRGVSVRPHLLQSSQQVQTEPGEEAEMYCKVCLLVLSSPESFYKHCASLDHFQLLSEDTTTKWTGRQPPHTLRAQLWLCDRPETCEYGDKCPKAHSEEELQEWMMRVTDEKQIRHSIEVQGLMPYNERLMQEYRNSSNEAHTFSDQVDNVSIFCDEDLNVECERIDETLQWSFQVETERQLLHVALLKQEPGASFTLLDVGSEPCIYFSGDCFQREDMAYSITVSFTSINPGTYEQWLVLDFNMRPVLLKKLRVRVGQMSLDCNEEQTGHRGAAAPVPSTRWHRENRVIIPCSSRTEEEDELLKEYKPPHVGSPYESSADSQTPLNNENYKERMHHFLYNEEQAEDKVVSRLNVCGEVTTLEMLTSTHFGMMIAPPGQLLCAVSIPCSLTPDTPEGQVLKRSIQSVLIAPAPSSGQNTKVYEASIQPDATSENKMYLQLSEKCCSDLKLEKDKSYQMEVQFQLNRFTFCTMHKAVDLLPDTKRVLPDLQKCAVPVNNIYCEKLNAKQLSAIKFITGKPSVQKFVAPLLIYGPFGTGKTFTLATAAKELCKQPGNKVLICTHTNSSADLYVREHFHPVIDKTNGEMTIIRIKSNKPRSAMAATEKITLKYCFLSKDQHSFLPPTKAALDGHKIVITTTSMAREFHGLRLPEGYFTHILIDEASQMLECEALMALDLAGPNTRVVLAGDHMQMGSKLFSVDDHDRSNHTLLNRLFHYYQGHKCDAAQSSRIKFSENYRSTKEIVEFVSTHFYVGKSDIIKAAGNIPAPANGRALKFHHVRGECLLDTVSMSWYNNEEIAKVIEEVTEILQHWPLTWAAKDQGSICVLSEGCQVRQIRTALKRRGLSQVCVENFANVQGKQFRAVIMTAVQTRDSLKTSHLAGLELFNDARVLNTAMTRAQSHVVVIGDAAALCCFGKCSGVWKTYIDHCIGNNSVAPQHFNKGFFESDVLETARFQKLERVDETNTLIDAILQELKDESGQLKIEFGSNENSIELEHFDQHLSSASDNITDVESDTETHNQGLYWESCNIPFQKPTKRITLQGRVNMRLVFCRDKLVLQTERAVSISDQELSATVYVCMLDDEDYSKQRNNPEDRFIRRTMIPLSKSEPKVRILLSKEKCNLIPIWKKIEGRWQIATYKHLNENLRRNNVFLVQLFPRKEGCSFPLGRVIDVHPVGQSLDHALWILDKEFNVAATTSEAGLSLVDEDGRYRQDMCDVITFTVDPEEGEDLDDAISVRDMGKQYELGIHIADVASYVIPGGKLDHNAKQLGATYYGSEGKIIHMFPKHLSTGRFSLLSDQVRKVVSLMFKVNKKTNEIDGKPEFQLSLIKSNKQWSYEDAGETISQRYAQQPRFDTVEDCVTVAYCFAKAQRKIRLGRDWPYSQPDDKRLPGARKANLMIEELSVLFNTHTAKTLIGSEKTVDCTPLRCQSRPNPERIEQFKQTKCAELTPLSFHVRHKVDHDENAPTLDKFRVLSKVWVDIQSAARTNDVDKMVDLIAADDIHPLLQPVIVEFRRCSSKASIVCSNSSREDVRHYSLNVQSYTQASSPIRRYMDVILQRLLHSFICNKNVQYTQKDISTLCQQFEKDIKTAKDYEQKAEQISYAVSMRQQSATKLAFVVNVDSNRESFAVSFPFNKNIFAENVAIMYKDLQLWDQPSGTKHCVTLTWKRRIYAVDGMKVLQQLNMSDSGPCVELPLNCWKDIVKAIDEEKWDRAKSLIMTAPQLEAQNMQQQPSEMPFRGGACTSKEQDEPKVQEGHEVDIKLQLQTGDTLNVQMTSELKRGYHMPAVQLLCIKPNFEICVDHAHSPITCFSRSADEPSINYYCDAEQYVTIWKPLCAMESADNAVAENDSIIIENLEVNFSEKQKGELSGSFFLPQAWINEWSIECNLSKCFLCIRKRGLKLTETLKHSALVDPREFTWVAHGVTRRVEEKKNPPNEGLEVWFYINHLSMEKIPDCVLQENTTFTVEIIQKITPDIRKENAVVSVPSACDLVKNIALGHRIPPEGRPTSRRRELSIGLPKLNTSQLHAVEKALSNSFTLIQGPPGTGKTVVGVYIVHHFFELNSKPGETQNPGKCDDPADEKKKEVILYCGPSNKSVDVVAEYLVKFGDRLRPLRVYGQQVEMLDYPYPDYSLQSSQRTLREERANSKLRSITLHHRMREDLNPYSGQIKDFDRRIQRVMEEKERLRGILSSTPWEKEEIEQIRLTIKELELTNAEVKGYKELLVKARTHEFKKHDIILCTCTQSSNPSLNKAVSARQILIDECAMATEPQALIPLVCNKPEKIVLIGDHKQLRPIVKNAHVKKLGMAKSLFERCYTMYENRAVMLDTQYRMHESICEFPSNEYYNGKLETGVRQPGSVLRVDNRTMPIVFGDIEGKTASLVVSTAKGNENSKANPEERNQVIEIVEKLVTVAKIDQQGIVVLSPYNAQVSEIKEELKRRKMDGIHVTTITKSQGSEWRYVIISTVCSVPSEDIGNEPDRAWVSKHVGFVSDPHQINVGITRAKEGLCIIGNQRLLNCTNSWRRLLDHYKHHNAVTTADKISVHC